jgi:hypothetical protein
MSRHGWTWAPAPPGTGGRHVPNTVRTRITQRIQRYAQDHFKGRYVRLDVRFRGKFCYVDAYLEPHVPKRLPKGFGETRAELLDRLRNTPTHLCRLRYFDEDRWGFAPFLYSSETYEESINPSSGDFFATPEEAFEIVARLHLG